MVYNPYIVIPLATWAVAQIAKFVLAALRGKLDFRYLYASGGMPSVHSAVVCSLATTSLLLDGPGSHLFGLTAVLAAIIIYDALGVRRATGEQGEAINMLMASLDRSKIKLEQPDLRLREVLGHKPTEVIVGGIVGVLLGGFFNYDHLGALGLFLQSIPVAPELWIYAGVFGLIVIAGWAQRLVLRARYRKSATIGRLTRRIVTASQTVGWIGLFTVLFQYERASYAAWRLWPLAMLAIGLAWAISLFASSYRTVPEALAAENDQARKLKWLRWGTKKDKSKR